MIVVDTSVWIDYFNGNDTPQATLLDQLLGAKPLAVGDLILVEILQGFRADRDFQLAKDLLSSLTIHEMLGQAMAIQSAQNYRNLRKKGITIRKTVDTIIATFCIANDHALLFSDKDFIPFVNHLGLRSAMM